jgi:aminoglycoside phosphotransferase (APT) family kinase protein
VLEALDRMREQWDPETLIHGDFKWSNLAGGRLLDWELAQWGDPAWDVGGAMHGMVVEDLLALELPGEGGPERLFEMLGEMLARRREDHRAFWSGYVAERGLPPARTAALQGRIPAATGLRLIKTAYEWCQAETRMPRRAAAILQLGINMVVRPEQAMRFVLGLP